MNKEKVTEKMIKVGDLVERLHDRYFDQRNRPHAKGSRFIVVEVLTLSRQVISPDGELHRWRNLKVVTPLPDRTRYHH